MSIMRPEEVFVTDGFPTHTYVPVESGKPEKDLAEGLEQKNKIISIAGPSKSGKTTLCDKVFGSTKGVDKMYVTGDAIAKPDDLWSEAYQQVIDDTDRNYYELSHAQRIERLIAAEMPLIIDDFHYISREFQAPLCRQLKNAASAGLRIVVLSIPHRGDDPIRSNSDLSGRYFSINFKFWDIPDLAKIAYSGFPKVGMPIFDDFISSLAGEAVKSPQVMQTLCLESCRSRPLDIPLEHTDRSLLDLADIRQRTLRSYNMSSTFHILESGPPERGNKRYDYSSRMGGKLDVYQTLVRILALDPPFDQIGLDDLKQRVRAVLNDKDEPNIRAALNQIEKLYKAADSPLDWDDEKRVLTIVDPHFYYYLRNRN